MRRFLIIIAKLIFKSNGESVSPYNSDFSRRLFKKWTKTFNKYNPLPQTDTKFSDFRTKLNEIIKKYKDSNHDYILNISKSHDNDLQLVHPYRFLHLNQDKSFIDFGFAIHISFDPSFKENQLNFEKFKQLDSYKEFIHENFDGIPCYHLNCYTDIDKTYTVTFEILSRIFDYSEDTKVYFDFYDEGSVQDNLKELNKKENSFSNKMRDKSDKELLNYIENQQQFEDDAIYAAAWELEKRGYKFER